MVKFYVKEFLHFKSYEHDDGAKLKSVWQSRIKYVRTCKWIGELYNHSYNYVAISGDVSFYLSTQRHYRRLIYYYIILLHVSVVRPSSGRN
jgi:hypothetical protein